MLLDYSTWHLSRVLFIKVNETGWGRIPMPSKTTSPAERAEKNGEGQALTVPAPLDIETDTRHKVHI